MRKNINLFYFLKLGIRLEELYLGMNLSELKEVLGEENDQIGDEEGGFLFFNEGLRIRYSGSEVVEIGIFFNKKEIKYTVKNEQDKKKHKITNKCNYIDIIKCLNRCGIEWVSWDEKSLDVLSIRTEGNILILVDIETDRIERIIQVNPVLFKLTRRKKWLQEDLDRK